MSIEEELNAILKKDRRKVGFGILRRLLSHGRYPEYTPIKEGIARSNWRIATSVPSGTIDKNVSPASIYAQLDAVADASIYHIANNLKYINRIMNEGHSKQTPVGSINLIIDRVLKEMENV